MHSPKPPFSFERFHFVKSTRTHVAMEAGLYRSVSTPTTGGRRDDIMGQRSVQGASERGSGRRKEGVLLVEAENNNTAGQQSHSQSGMRRARVDRATVIARSVAPQANLDEAPTPGRHVRADLTGCRTMDRRPGRHDTSGGSADGLMAVPVTTSPAGAGGRHHGGDGADVIYDGGRRTPLRRTGSTSSIGNATRPTSHGSGEARQPSAPLQEPQLRAIQVIIRSRSAQGVRAIARPLRRELRSRTRRKPTERGSPRRRPGQLG